MPALMLALAVVAFVIALVSFLPRQSFASFWERWTYHRLEPELGAVTLVQAALLSQDNLQRGVIETFVQESVVLDTLPFMPIEGNAYAYNEEGGLPGVEFRAVNAAYTESTGTVNQKTEKLVILGGDADVDTFIVRTRGNINDQRATQTRMKVKAATYMFQDAFVNGDVAVDANSFDGLKKRLTGAQAISTGTNGMAVLGADDAARHAFLDQFDAAIAAVPGAQVAYMNTAIRAKLISSLRRLRSNVESVGRLPAELIAGGVRVVEPRIPVYNGVALVDIGNTAAGTAIIPVTETQGTSTDSSSIYVVRFGEDESDGAVTGLFNGPSATDPIEVRDLGEQDFKPVFRTRIEFFCGLASFGAKGAARLLGVRNA